MTTINVYYAIDKGTRNFKMTLLSIISLCESNKDNLINIYLLNCQYKNYCTKIDDDDYLLIKKFVKSYKNDNGVFLIDIEQILTEKFHKSKQTWNNCPKPIVWARHLLPFINFNFPEKLLWLDSDTLVLKDLKDLFNINIEKYSWAGAYDTVILLEVHFLYFTIFKKHDTSFLQNGVMLLNTKKVIPYMEKLVNMERRCRILDDLSKFNQLTSFDKLPIDNYFNNYGGSINQNTYIFHTCACNCNIDHKIKPSSFGFWFRLPIILKHGFKFLKNIDSRFAEIYGKRSNTPIWTKISVLSNPINYSFHSHLSNKKGLFKTADEEIFLKAYPQFSFIYKIYHQLTGSFPVL